MQLVKLRKQKGITLIFLLAGVIVGRLFGTCGFNLLIFFARLVFRPGSVLHTHEAHAPATGGADRCSLAWPNQGGLATQNRADLYRTLRYMQRRIVAIDRNSKGCPFDNRGQIERLYCKGVVGAGRDLKQNIPHLLRDMGGRFRRAGWRF